MKTWESPIIGIEKQYDLPFIYNQKGDYSVIIKFTNPVINNASSEEFYEEFVELFDAVIRILGENTLIQKQDILTKKKLKRNSKQNDFLQRKYFSHFEGREYVEFSTYLVFTKQLKKGFFGYDSKSFKNFSVSVKKVFELFSNKKIKYSIPSEKEIKNYLYRFISFDFSSNVLSFDNIKSDEHQIKIGKKYVQNISLVDIDEMEVPKFISPFEINKVGIGFPVDIMSFLEKTPRFTDIVFNQVVFYPSQRTEITKLEGKRKKHSSMPDPANLLCVKDIDSVLNDIANDSQLLVYSHFNFIVGCNSKEDLFKARNYIDGQVFDRGIVTSRNAYNQMELYQCSFPGNAFNLQIYDKFLTVSSSAFSLLFKEAYELDEKSPFITYFTNRKGIPVAIDPSGKEGMVKLTNNSNKFVLGPSGSGKSFCMNGLLRQYGIQDTDIVLVDTGHSYSGLCKYYKGKYITYSEEQPITMNPFLISEKEFNNEKRDFLKSLIALLWKGADGSINQVEDTLLGILINKYYQNFFDGELQELSFNSFFEFTETEIPKIIETERVEFNLNDFRFILKKFYKGGQYETILNNNMDKSLFDEKFIVFEIDNIKEDKTLFPIVTLIIMDVFLQKMRLKKGRKALIIEEAWKAIASPMMAGYILYLYKTVRKFWGECVVVTQELDDIINNPVVKNSIVNNSDTIILLDQSKFQENYKEIAALLSLTEVDKRKIFTINKLDNKDNRSYFKEAFIRRGSKGEVYGIEVSVEEYFTFTTERIEKEAVECFTEYFEDYEIGLENFCKMFRKSKTTPFLFSSKVVKSFSKKLEKGLTIELLENLVFAA